MQASVIFDEILHDTLAIGALAAQIFVKNPAHQVVAGNVISAVAQLLPVLDAQFGVSQTAASQPTAPAPAPPAPEVSGPGLAKTVAA